MRQIYFCPNCRAPIGYADRFCGNCGINLKWEIQQIPPESLPLRYDCQNPGQQQSWSSQQLVPLNHVATSSGERSSFGGDVTPLSAEISKLLEDFFDKRSKCTWHKCGAPNKS